jgi:5-oxopent-3-ene-1,2,5-tricarboxylate decarboxylase/2-hydroxyhepta-2,4-diene-1,7-dioate isomerase
MPAMSSFPSAWWSTPPHTWGRAVYGVVLNHRPALAALGDAVHQPPYKTPPQWPVLYIKPRNTHCGDGPVGVPHDVPELELGATLGVVMGRTTQGVSPDQALSQVAGYVTVADVRVPHQQFYRPHVRLIARDGFCPIAQRITPAIAMAHPDQLEVKVWVDGALVHHTDTADRIRGVAQLIADVSSYMTLYAGDILLLGVSHGAPRVRVGQQSRIEIEGLTPLTNRFVPEEPAP